MVSRRACEGGWTDWLALFPQYVPQRPTHAQARHLGHFRRAPSICAPKHRCNHDAVDCNHTEECCRPPGPQPQACLLRKPPQPNERAGKHHGDHLQPISPDHGKVIRLVENDNRTSDSRVSRYPATMAGKGPVWGHSSGRSLPLLGRHPSRSRCWLRIARRGSGVKGEVKQVAGNGQGWMGVGGVGG